MKQRCPSPCNRKLPGPAAGVTSHCLAIRRRATSLAGRRRLHHCRVRPGGRGGGPGLERRSLGLLLEVERGHDQGVGLPEGGLPGAPRRRGARLLLGAELLLLEGAEGDHGLHAVLAALVLAGHLEGCGFCWSLPVGSLSKGRFFPGAGEGSECERQRALSAGEGGGGCECVRGACPAGSA